MSEFDKQDADVIVMCNWNHRRSNITTTIGYIVPKEQAERIAYEEAMKKHGGDWVGSVVMILGTIAVIAMTLAAVI